MSATLLHIGVPHLVEYVTPDGLFSIDIALRNGNQVLLSDWLKTVAFYKCKAAPAVILAMPKLAGNIVKEM